MTTLAWHSLRHRLPAFTATFLAVFLSVVVVGSFAGLAETATGPLSAADRDTLVLMGAVVGSWGALLACFSLVSTLGLAVRQRDTEMGLLRTIGATPRQGRRLIHRESLIVTSVAAVAGVLPAWMVGAVLLALLRDHGMVSEGVRFGGGPVSLSLTVVMVVLVSLVAAEVASRRALRGSVHDALAEEVGAVRVTRWRAVGGGVLLLGGIGMALTTILVTRHSDDPFAAMQTSGSAGIVVAVGLAAFAPMILRRAGGWLVPVLDRCGAVGHLASLTTHRRSHLLGAVLGPVIVFVAASTGVLMLMGIENRTRIVPPGMTAVELTSLTLLNNVVVGMIAVFCALILVSALLAVVGDRRVELARMRLLGATAAQVRAAVLVESMIVAAVGSVAALVASTATVVPFALARGEGLVPDGQLWLPVTIVALAAALTLATARVATARALAAQQLTEVVAAA